ncbi:MAG: hypothetical protein ACO273_12490, partial [Burkholderiales bacterium]
AKLADQLAAMQANLAKINGVARNVETLISMEKQKPVAVAPAPVAAPVAAPPQTPTPETNPAPAPAAPVAPPATP